MRPHLELARQGIGPDPPEDDRQRQEEAGDQPPTALGERRQPQSVLGRRRLEGEPEQLPHELEGIPVHRGEHVQPDDLESEDEEQDGQHARGPEIERADLRIADLAEPVVGARLDAALPDASRLVRHAGIMRRVDLHTGEEILVFSHGFAPQFQIGMLSHQAHQSVQLRVQNGPLTTMQMALQTPAFTASSKPKRWMPRVPME